MGFPQPGLTGEVPAGGASGQLLVKTSAADFALGWTNDAPYPSLSLVDAKGDLLVGTADNAEGRLAVGVDGMHLAADSTQATGQKWVLPSRSIAAVTTDQTVVNSISETVVVTLPMPVTAAIGDIFVWRIAAELLNNTGAAVTYVFRPKLGTTNAFGGSNTFSVAANAVRRLIWIEGTIYIVSPTTDQRFACELNIGVPSAGGLPIGIALGTSAGRGTAAEDLTAGKNMSMTIQLGTADPNASFTVHEATLEVSKR